MNANKIILDTLKIYKMLGICYLIDDLDDQLDTSSFINAPLISSKINNTEILNNTPKNNPKLNQTTQHDSDAIHQQSSTTYNPINLDLHNDTTDCYHTDSLTAITDLITLKSVASKLNVSLKHYALNMVFCDGDSTSDIMLIGEAPGKEEDEQGLPFVGRSGQLLMQAFSSIGLPREKLFITNTVFWRPAGNEVPKEKDIMTCKPIIMQMINIVKPKFIILVGKTACFSMLSHKSAMSTVLGKWIILPALSEINIRAIYHPAYLLRYPTKKKILWEDLLELKQLKQQLNLIK